MLGQSHLRSIVLNASIIIDVITPRIANGPREKNSGIIPDHGELYSLKENELP